MHETHTPSAKSEGAKISVRTATFGADAAGTPAARTTRSRIRRVASSLLFQSTALAGTFAGFPVPIYSRAYAGTTCSPSSVTSDYVNNSSKTDATTFTCTITSSSSSPQYAYGGAYMAFDQLSDAQVFLSGTSTLVTVKGTYEPAGGLNIAVVNEGDITVGASAATSSILTSSLGSSNQRFLLADQSAGLSVVSRGSLRFADPTDKSHYGTGASGGDAKITNSGTITSTVGGGIYALSKGGDNYYGSAGAAGNVTVSSTADVTGKTFGIVAISQGGGAASGLDNDHTIASGTGGNVQINVSGSVSATASGPAVFGASYGGAQA
ncbi:hypothetical protein [Amorphus sp. MBR-141]